MSRNLEPMRDLRAYVLEDAVVHAGLPRGRYPVESPNTQEFQDLNIRSDTQAQRATADRLRSDRDRTLALNGWTVFEAEACLFAAGKSSP